MVRVLRAIGSTLPSLILALLLALVIWATAIRASDPTETRAFEIGVETVNRPADATLVNRPPEVVLITVEGPTSALDRTTPGDYRAVIDLTDVPYGESEVSIRVEGGQEQVVVGSVYPAVAEVRLEQIVTREVPVMLDLRGEVARGHALRETQLEPGTVQISGPSSRVDQVEAGQVVVFLDNSREGLTELRRPIYYDAQGNVVSVVGLTVNPTEVEVIIDVEELEGFAEKPITVNWTGEPAPGYRLLDVRVEPNSIQVSGPPGELDSVRVETEPIDISGLSESETREVALDLPAGVTPLELEPVIVTVVIEPILTSAAVQEPVEIRALGEGLTATLDPPELRVFLFGPLPVLDSLEEDDVRVTLDLLNREPGEYIMQPIVTVRAQDVTVRSTQPAEITVIISETLTATETLGATIPAAPAGGTSSQPGTGGSQTEPEARGTAAGWLLADQSPAAWRRREALLLT
jgi:YbbR domain-containing protein